MITYLMRLNKFKNAVVVITSLSLIIAPLSITFAKGGRGGGWRGGKSWGWWGSSKSSSWSTKKPSIKSSSTPKVKEKAISSRKPIPKRENKKEKKESNLWTLFKYYILYKLFFGKDSGRAQKTSYSEENFTNTNNTLNTPKSKENKK